VLKRTTTMPGGRNTTCDCQLGVFSVRLNGREKGSFIGTSAEEDNNNAGRQNSNERDFAKISRKGPNEPSICEAWDTPRLVKRPPTDHIEFAKESIGGQY
jgi:hypothetical protein